MQDDLNLALRTCPNEHFLTLRLILGVEIDDDDDDDDGDDDDLLFVNQIFLLITNLFLLVSYEPFHLALRCLTFSLSTLRINFFSSDSLLKKKSRR